VIDWWGATDPSPAAKEPALNRSWLGWLRSWPLLLGAVIAFAFGVWLTQGTEQRVYIAGSLITVGCILLGVWIAMLVRHDHTGETEAPPPEGDDDASE
jgi:hypothetical protein